jgi:hypothetical protein
MSPKRIYARLHSFDLSLMTAENEFFAPFMIDFRKLFYRELLRNMNCWKFRVIVVTIEFFSLLEYCSVDIKP